MTSEPKLVTTPEERAAAKRRRQLILVVLLLIGFLIALAAQPKSNPSDEQVAVQVAVIDAPVKLKASRPDVQSADAPSADAVSFTEPRSLSRIEIDDAVRLNLFRARAKPQTLVATQAAKSESIVIDAIYGDQQHAVLVDGRVLHVGQTLPNGRKLLSVSPDGVQLSQ